MDILVRKMFKLWKSNIDHIKLDFHRQICLNHDEWNKYIEEDLDETEYARVIDMDSIHWCWNCKYSECDRH